MKSTESFKRPPTWGEAQEAKRVAHGLPIIKIENVIGVAYQPGDYVLVHPESFKIQDVITDCVLVQPDPNAHLGATEE